MRLQANVPGKVDTVDAAFEVAFDGLFRRIMQFRTHGKLRRAAIEMRCHAGKANGHGTGCAYGDIAPQPHILVGRLGIPVHERDGEIVRRGRENFDG